MGVDVVWIARANDAMSLVDAHVRGELTYSELCEAFYRRGWSTRYLFEAVINAERSPPFVAPPTAANPATAEGPTEAVAGTPFRET